MKSFFTYPLELKPVHSSPVNQNNVSGKLIAHQELFEKIAHLDGFIIKCGITAEEGLTRFEMLNHLMEIDKKQKMVAFQKLQPLFEEEVTEDGTITLKVNNAKVSFEKVIASLDQNTLNPVIDFLPGLVCETIPQYLIDNPELKIALLNIDLDDYDETMTTLEFLYPRLMPGGILMVENYHKRLSEFKAINDYYHPRKIEINNFSVSAGPHYIIKP